MAIQRFEDVIVWQKSQDWAVSIYAMFKSNKDFGYRNQICNAVVSVSNNIAEGFDRGTNREFKRFLDISMGSCSEVKSMLYLGERLSYINKEELRINLAMGNEICKIIRGLIKSLK